MTCRKDVTTLGTERNWKELHVARPRQRDGLPGKLRVGVEHNHTEVWGSVGILGIVFVIFC